MAVAARDYSGYDNTGIYSGSGFTWGVAGTEIIKTDPANTGVTLTSPGTITLTSPKDMGTAAVTVGTWFKTGTALAHDLIIQTGTANGTWKLQTTTTTIKFSIYSGGTASIVASGSVSYANDAWHHVMATYDRSYVRLYVDGSLIGAAGGTVYVNGTASIEVPGPSAGSRTQDEVSVYANALSERSVYRHYASGIATYNKLRIRARAYSPNAWIAGYEAVPVYAQVGRLLEPFNQTISVYEANIGETFGTPTLALIHTIAMGTAQEITTGEAFGSPSLFRSGIYPDSIDLWAGLEDRVGRPGVSLAAGTAPAFRSYFSEAFGGTQRILDSTKVPTGAANNDIIIGVLCINSDAMAHPSVSWPSGWTELSEDAYDAEGTDDNHVSIAWRRYTGSGGLGTVTWGSPGTGTLWATLGLLAYSGASTATNPIDITGSWNFMDAWGTSFTQSGVTTTVNNCRVIGISYHEDTRVITDPSGTTRRLFNGYAYVFDFAQGTAGATGNKTYARSDSNSILDAGRMIAIRPVNT